MNTIKPAITFFTPTFQKTGSELVLFNLLKCIPDSLTVNVVCKYKGMLFDKLPDRFCKDYIFKKQTPTTWMDRIVRRFFSAWIIHIKLRKYHHSLWYINTIMLPDIMDYAVKHKIRVILHVHEMKQMFQLLSERQIEAIVNYPNLIIANSTASRDVLLSYNVKPEIAVSYPAVHNNDFEFKEAKYISQRKKLGIQKEFVWVMSGSYDENKNPKLFVDITCLLKQSGILFKMIWIGSTSGYPHVAAPYKNYSAMKGVADKIIWMDDTDEYYECMNCADGFVLTSRLESFSLVTLEALRLGLPVVANNCKGVSEILGSGYGVIVDNENAIAMSDEMIKYMKAGNCRNIAKGKELASRFDPDQIKSDWLTYLQKNI